MLEAQNKRIDDLVNRIRLQQDKLDKQNVRIRTLQNQVWNTSPFENVSLFMRLFCMNYLKLCFLAPSDSADKRETSIQA
jgi:hypothetical protein